MRDKVFLDTNLWFYLYSDDEKSTVVANLIKKEFDHIILSRVEWANVLLFAHLPQQEAGGQR